MHDEISQHRGQHETDEQWEMRKKFLVMHWGEFSTNRLLCLSQALLNVHFLGCKYSPELMETLRELGRGVLEEFASKSEGRLKRTLASAGNAAQSKVAKAKPNYNKNDNRKSKNDVIYKATEQQDSFPKHLVTPVLESNTLVEVEYYPTSSLTKLVLLEITKPNDAQENPRGIVDRSVHACQLRASIETVAESSMLKYMLYIGQCKVLSALFENKKSVMPVIYDLAYRYLKKNHYTVRYKMDTNEGDEIVAKMDVSGPSGGENQQVSSVGAKLLQMLGWKGGGLGKNEQGIAEPVQVESVIGRSGLGYSGGPALTQQQLRQFKKDVFDYLRRYQVKGSTENLKFSSEFTSEERAVVHKVARSLRLQSQSFGGKDNRTLVISHPIPKTSLIEVVNFWKASGCVRHPQVVVIPPLGQPE